jgi:serine/threonine protein kinase
MDCQQLQGPMDVPSQPNSPRSRFEIMSTIGENLGRNNAGILIVGDNTTGRYCVEKRLKPSDIADGHAQREIQILMQLKDHPNIVQLVDFELKDDPKLQGCEMSARTWTEYCETGSLLDFVGFPNTSKQRIAEPLLWHILTSLAEAVRYLQQGPKESPDVSWNMVYHRDIHLAGYRPQMITSTLDVMTGGQSQGLRNILRLRNFHFIIQSQTYIRLGRYCIASCTDSLRLMMERHRDR